MVFTALKTTPVWNCKQYLPQCEKQVHRQPVEDNELTRGR